MKLGVTGELHQARSLLVEYYNQNLLITETAQLNCFLQKSSLPLAEGYVSLKSVLDTLQLINFIFSHVGLAVVQGGNKYLEMEVGF